MRLSPFFLNLSPIQSCRVPKERGNQNGILAFDGNLVGQINSFNDDGAGGTEIEVDDSADLDGSGNPYYSATDTILIEIDDADIDANGEFIEGGADGKITVLSIKVNGVELLSSPDNIKFGGGSITEMGDGYFFIEGLKLAFLSPATGVTFEDAALDGGKLILNVPEQTGDYDLNESGECRFGHGRGRQWSFQHLHLECGLLCQRHPDHDSDR